MGSHFKIEHVAMWVKDIELIKDFYTKYFGGTANKKYINESKGFESYFISFNSGARLEIMKMPEIKEKQSNTDIQFMGLIHIAFSVGDKKTVIDLTEQLRIDGYKIASEPRTTGDGYFESCVYDPENNKIEITV